MFTLASCGGGGGSTPKPTPLPTVEPTLEPTVEPTLEPVSGAEMNAAWLEQPAAVSAGDDIFVASGSMVDLAASVANPGKSPISYTWQQLSGTAVVITDSDSSTASFVAPSVDTATQLLFKVSSTDADGLSSADTVRVNLYSSANQLRLEAEDAILNGVTVAQQWSGYSGTGYVTGFTSDEKSVSWSVTTTEGFYDLAIGFYSADKKGFELTIDGKGTSGMTEAVEAFNPISAGAIWLSAGDHTISVGGGWGWYDIDYIELSPLVAPQDIQAVDPLPVNTQATKEARQLYQYLVNNYGVKTLSGQHGGNDITTVISRTGEAPAIYSKGMLQYSSLAVRAMGLPESETEDFISTIQSEGHIASLLWHWHSPMHAKSTVNPCPSGQSSCWWNSFYTEHTDFDLGQALADTDSDEYAALISDIDAMAVQLKKIQNANIPVLWRPLHESDGGWFWWGAAGAENFKTLWRIMYARLTYHHEVNNLLWVLTAENTDWYPGDDVVDITSIDAYPSDKSDVLSSVWNEMFQRFDGHKMIALTEFGGVPFIDQMREQGVRWSYFASWQGDLGPDKMTDTELNAVYTSANVVNQQTLNLPAPIAPDGGKILPLGDSITGSPGCWRQKLWAGLQEAGLSSIDFVGSENNATHCGINYDGDHEGHGGFLARDIVGDNQLPAWLENASADAVMMHLGTNDIWNGISTKAILESYTSLVSQMREDNSAMVIFVAQLIPMNPTEYPCASCADAVIALNQAIPTWARSLSTEESPIVIVDQWTGFDVINDTSDGVHPTESGNEKLSSKWLSAIKAVYQ